MDTVTLPEGLTNIQTMAFKNTAVKNIVIPSTVTAVAPNSFSYCKNLETIKVQDGNTTLTSKGIIDGDTVECNAVIKGKQLFVGCKNTIIPSNVTQIMGQSFAGSGIKSIILPSTLTGASNGFSQVFTSAFKDCKSLESVSILFKNNNTNATLGNHIGITAFEGCTALKTIVCSSEQAVRLASASFPSQQNITLYVPAGAWNSYKAAWSIDTNYWTIEESLQLYTDRWNFIAGLSEQASVFDNNIPASFVNGFTVDTNINDPSNANNPHCDIAVIGYDYSTNNWSNNYLYANDTMTKGAGYFVWPFSENYQATQITPSGAVTIIDNYHTTDLQTVNLTTQANNGSSSGSGSTTGYWYSFGNPFDKALTIDSVFVASPSNNGTQSSVYINNDDSTLSAVQGNMVYLYDEASQEWTELSSGKIPSGRGFMVASAQQGKTATCNMVYPSSNAKATIKSDIVNDKGIMFTVTSGDNEKYMYAQQVEQALDGFDVKDAYILFSDNENKVEPYFIVDNNAIKYNRYNSNTYTCNIGFHALKDGVAKISVSNIPEGTLVSIIDIATDVETILEENMAFDFNVEQGENLGKYKVKISKGALSITDIAKADDVTIWNNKGNIHISGKDLKTVELVNTLGQSVYMQHIGNNEFDFNFDIEGTYVIRVKSSNGVKVQKLVITK